MEIIIRNLIKSFPSLRGSNFKLVVEELIVRRCETTYLMGHNGSGKSVLSKLIYKEIEPDSGEVEIRPTVSVGMVRQHADENLALNLSVAENLLLSLGEIKGLDNLFPQRISLSNAKSVLDGHGTLGGSLNDVAGDLSGGQRQAMAFFMSIARSPDILILDEFLASTDEPTKRALNKDISKYKKLEKAVFVVSHDIELALNQADRIIILNRGKLIDDFFKEVDSNKWSIKYLEEQLA